MKPQKTVQVRMVILSIICLYLLQNLNSCKNADKSDVVNEDSVVKSEDSTPKTTEHQTDTQAANDYKDRLHDVVETMNKNLGRIELTNNPDQDFARLMTTDLLSGIEICLLHQKKGIDPNLKQVARQKQTYLQQLENFFDSYQFNNENSFVPLIRRKAPTLKHMTIPQTANVDVVFATVISEYNQNTIDLARNYINSGTNGKVKKAIEEIIQNFSAENQRLKKLLQQ